MKKLQRYRPHWDVFAGCECELYLLGAAGMPADKKDSDVYSAPEVDALISALEAENERLLEENKELKIEVEADVYCHVCGACGESGCCSPKKCKEGAHCMYPGFSKEEDCSSDGLKSTLIDVADELVAILNREQEKQP